MNKRLREDMEYLIQCDDKAITPDVKDDVKMTLDYIDELEKENNEWSMIFDTFSKRPYAHKYLEEKKKELGNKNIVGLDSEMIYKDYYELKTRIDKTIEYIKENSCYNITLVQNALIGKDIDELLKILGVNGE